MSRRIDVNIAELALRGLPSADGARIASALARELGRLLAEGDRPIAVEPRTDARAPDIHLAGNETSGRIGGRIAQAIYRQLAR